jgi:histidinol phosphatase-like PHP family hydrolase
VPVSEIKPLVKLARKGGAKIVVVHGETVSEPVIPGTNRAAIEAGCDILAHPGLISEEDVRLAKRKGVYLEITSRKSHSKPNKRLVILAREAGAKLVLNTDSHSDDTFISDAEAGKILTRLGLAGSEVDRVFNNSRELVKRAQE